MAAVNQYTETIPRFGPDPYALNQAAAVADLVESSRGLGGGIYRGARGDGSNGSTWEGNTGYQVQHFIGAAALALAGEVRQPNTTGNTPLALSLEAQANLSDPALRIFAARASRMKGMGRG